MRVVFMGTPEFAVPSLRKLAEAAEVTLVVTRPDAVRSRGKKLEPSPVKVTALELGIPVLEASRIREEQLAAVRAAEPDLIAVAAYGCILPDALLEIAPKGCVNVHASLLPRWRGAAPVQRAVLAGDECVGVSIMEVVHELDAGAYCAQASCEVGERGSAELLLELAELGANELVNALPSLEDGTAVWQQQDESLVTYAHKIDKSEMRLAPAVGALANLRRVRASSDAAPARLSVDGKGARVLTAAKTDASAEPGELRVQRGHVYLGCADGTLELLRVKPDGKREMDASAWAAGLRGKSFSWSEV